ncbi:DUF4259 domain-containing protein [Flagellimonas sp. 2504JD4-2]
MGSWGIKALESDNGLDVIEFLEDLYSGKTALVLSEIVSSFVEEGLLGKDSDEIDYFYDNTAISVAELLIIYKEKGELDYDNEDEKISLRKKTHFHSDKKSIEFILRCLTDIKNEKPDKDGIREYVELKKESASYERWKEHLESLISKLNNEIN